jgi:hypothetical protein
MENQSCFHCEHQYFCHAFIEIGKVLDKCRIFKDPNVITVAVAQNCKNFVSED